MVSRTDVSNNIVLSRASKQCLCIIGASSQIINLVLIIKCAKGVPYFKLHVESLVIFSGITNLECVVRPPGNKRDAIPLDATVKTSPLDRMAADRVFQI